jgi:DNA-binding CsgD family transcriptional regulator
LLTVCIAGLGRQSLLSVQGGLPLLPGTLLVRSPRPGDLARLLTAHGEFAGQPRSGRKPQEITGITDREREVLRLVGLGMSNAEIAAALCITVGTAKTHVARQLAKLGARDRVQLVITAYEAGLVSASC